MSRAYAGKASAMESVAGIDPEHAIAPDIVEVVCNEDETVVKVHLPVEVPQDEETGKPELRPPERVGNPGVEIVIIGRRTIVGNEGWPCRAVGGADHGRVRVVVAADRF